MEKTAAQKRAQLLLISSMIGITAILAPKGDTKLPNGDGKTFK